MWNPFKKKALTLKQKIGLAESLLVNIPKMRERAIQDLHWTEDTYEPHFHIELNKARRKHRNAISLIKHGKKHLIWINTYEKKVKERLNELKEKQRQATVLTNYQ